MFAQNLTDGQHDEISRRQSAPLAISSLFMSYISITVGPKCSGRSSHKL